jgi:hypothetical protein
MFKKYDCTNDDGTYDAYNSCYLHNDKKGFNYFLDNDADVNISIFARTKENVEGKFESNIQVKEQYPDGTEISKHNVTFTSDELVNMENVYQNFEDEFTESSNKNWNEIFDEYLAFASPEKVEGQIKNSDIWNELKNENNVDLEITGNWNYNGWGNRSDHYIKNEKENIVFHSRNDNNFSYEEKRKPNSEEMIEIKYENYNDVPDFTIGIDKNDNVSFNGLSPEELINKNDKNSKNNINILKEDTFERSTEKIKHFIKEISERMPDTQNSAKAVKLLEKGLKKVAKKVSEQKEVKNNKTARS